jgi:hypothetical protein
MSLNGSRLNYRRAENAQVEQFSSRSHLCRAGSLQP